VALGGVHFTVLEVEGTRIEKIEIEIVPVEASAENGEQGADD
jgi:hypothetical protein